VLDHSAGKDVDRVRVLTAMAARLEQPEPNTSLIPERVQVITMHGAKGLSAKVVFIPGLEEASLPGEKRRAYPGLVLEAARIPRGTAFPPGDGGAADPRQAPVGRR
jgi:superfamily I DNA/RNA helicase